MREELGRGGFGAVYAAHDPQLNRDVAVKLLLPRKGRSDGKWEARLVREAQTLAQVRHPNVVEVYDVGVDARTGGVYVVMALLRGRTARAWVETAPQPAWQHVVEAFVGAGRGLAAAHAEGIVHRDFKPDNVMLGPDGVAKVIDFGLARDVDQMDSTRVSGRSGEVVTISGLTSMGTVMGTPPYMPPEQHEGPGVGTLGPASDQYAFCVSLFETLYRVRPFIADDLDALYEAKRTLSFQPLPKGHGIPMAIHRALVRGLQPQASDRWPSMDALIQALERAARPSRRVAATLGAAAVAVTMLAVGLGARHDDPCQALRERAAAVWSPERVERLQGRERGVAWASAHDRLEARFAAWHGALETACPADESPAVRCLEQWLRDADAAVTVLEEGTSSPGSSLSVVDTIPQPSRCGERRWSVRPEDDALRDAFVRSRALARAGRGEAALAAAAEAVEAARTTDDPILLAQATLTHGVVLAEREHLFEARTLLIESVGLATAQGLDEVATEASVVLIRVSGATGAFEDAHRWVAQAEAGLSRLGWPADLHRAFLASRVFELIYEGDFGQAYALGQSLVTLLPEDTMAFERGRALANVAMVAFELGRMHEARAVVAQAHASLVTAVGEQHPAAARVLADQGRYAAAAGDVEPGVASMQQAVSLLEAAGGSQDPYALNTKRTLADYLARLGRFDESLAMMEQTYAGTVALYGQDHVRTVFTAFGLADQYLVHDRPADAVPLVREAMASLTALFGADDPRQAVGAELLGRALALQNRFDEARDLVTRALAGLSTATPGERESTVNLTMVLAGIDQDEGRLDDAARNLERAIELCEGDPALYDPSMLASLEGARAFVEVERGRPKRAVTAARRTLDFLDRIGADASEKAEFEQLVAAHG